MSDDFDRELRATLRSGADASRVPDGLAQRLVANARAGHTTVVPLRSARRASRWTAPLLAAAAVLIVVGGSITAATLSAGHRDGDVDPPVAPSRTSTVPTPTPTVTPTRTTSHTPSHTNTPTATHTPTHVAAPVTTRPAPTDFKAAGVQFRDAAHGDALGIGDCSGTGAGSCSVRLIATDDGGDSWYRLGLPTGLHSMFPTAESNGSCASNGNILGPCVDRVLFADADHGYLWGFHVFYRTDDAGRHWQQERPSGSDPNVTVNALTVHGTTAYRVKANGAGSAGVAGVVQRAAVGSGQWTTIGPGQVGADSAQLAVTDNAIYVGSSPFVGSDKARIYRSGNGGASWKQVATGDFVDGLVAAPDGSVGALMANGNSMTLQIWSATGTLVATRHRGSGSVAAGENLVGLGSSSRPVVEQLGMDGAPQVFLRSTNGGASFRQTGSISDGSPYDDLAHFAGLIGWSETPAGTLYVTTDGGASWHTVGF